MRLPLEERLLKIQDPFKLLTVHRAHADEDLADEVFAVPLMVERKIQVLRQNVFSRDQHLTDRWY